MKLKVTATIEVNSTWNSLDKEELEWFTDCVLNNKQDTMLILYSNDIGDEIGSTTAFKYEILPNK
jgi:hypothetical protein